MCSRGLRFFGPTTRLVIRKLVLRSHAAETCFIRPGEGPPVGEQAHCTTILLYYITLHYTTLHHITLHHHHQKHTITTTTIHSHHHHACDAHGAYASSLIMVSCVRNHSREAAAAPPRPQMATSRRHPLFLFFGPPTPNDTQQSRRGAKPRYSGPNESRSADGHAPGTGTLRMGFAQLTASRSRLARTRHHRRQSSVTSEFGDVAEFWCTGPTPSDAASPVCPSRHHAAGYGQSLPGLQRVQHDFHPITMCTSYHSRSRPGLLGRSRRSQSSPRSMPAYLPRCHRSSLQ